ISQRFVVLRNHKHVSSSFLHTALINGNFVETAFGKMFPATYREVNANVAEGNAEDIIWAVKTTRKTIDEGF
ncbi:hypothetical protein HID58_032991, partial [Brassica napus]